MESSTSLTADKIILIAGTHQSHPAALCPSCGDPIPEGAPVVTTLGDLEVRALGVTVHRECAEREGRAGLLRLMIAAFQDYQSTQT